MTFGQQSSKVPSTAHVFMVYLLKKTEVFGSNSLVVLELTAFLFVITQVPQTANGHNKFLKSDPSFELPAHLIIWPTL